MYNYNWVNCYERKVCIVILKGLDLVREFGKSFPKDLSMELKTKGRVRIDWQIGWWWWWGEGAFNIDGEAYAKVLWPIRGADRKSVCLECRERCCELK